MTTLSDTAPADRAREPGAPDRSPGGRRPLQWWREITLIVVFYGCYTAIRDIRGTRPVSVSQAFHNAERVISLEKHLGIFHEAQIQHLVLPHRTLVQLLDVWYGSTHFVVTAAVLAVLFFRFPQRYRRWRNTLAVATALALIGFALFPLMPPRLLPARFGFTDTLGVVGGLWDFDSGPMAQLSNQFAAMPSLHFAWALWCSLAITPLLRRRVWRWAMGAYPVVTLACVIVTANHYFLDTAAGALTVLAGYWCSRLLETRGSGRETGRRIRRRPPERSRMMSPWPDESAPLANVFESRPLF
ncbi:MAG: phosphatase PAP2 family protein [Acidimicrobiales bacterium]